MNLHYHKWLDLKVTNNYFDKGIDLNFKMVPFKTTAHQMRNYEIMMKKESDSFSFYAGVEVEKEFNAKEDLKGLGLVYFQLINDDPLFFNYTDVSPVSNQKVYFFQNNTEDINKQTLQEENVVTTKDFIGCKAKTFNIDLPNKQMILEIKTFRGELIKSEILDGTIIKNYLINLNFLEDGVYQLWIDDEIQESFFISDEQIAPNCIGIIQLDVEKIKNQDQLNYSIDFNARTALWQYQIVVRNARKILVSDMSVTGVENEVYEGPLEQKIIGGQIAQVFTTSKPIQLKNKIEKNPQLQMMYSNEFSNRKNQLDIKLPNPDPEQLKINNKGKDNEMCFSTTIVYV